MKNLKDTTQEHFKDIALSTEQMEKLNALISQGQDDVEVENPKPSIIPKLIFATAVILILGFLMFGVDGEDKSSLIAQEVAYNHQKLKPLEITSERLKDVANYFASHQIRVVENSRILGDFDWNLKGGRFCSIQGSDAAQLRYKTKGDETVSVYMAPYSEETMGKLPVLEQGDKPQSVVSNGGEVWIWVEQNQVIATTVPRSH